jgi:spore germination protein GerM
MKKDARMKSAQGERKVSRLARFAVFLFGLFVMFGIVFIVIRLSSPTIGNKTLSLMFANLGYSSLRPVSQEVRRELWYRDPLKTVVRALMDGPINNETLPVIPAGTKLRACWRAGDIAYVDFGRDFFLGLAEEAEAEVLAVYGLVNTIAENIPEIKKVQILIDGAPRITLRGLTRVYQPLTPRRELEK